MGFVCLCVCEHMRTYLCTHVETEEGIRLPLVLSALFPRENTSLNPELITFQPGWQPTSLMGLPAFTYPSAVTIGAHAHAWFFMWMAAGYANIGLPACITRALSSWTIFPSLVLFVLVLMMHHDGLHYDIFIHVLTVFQSGSSQLSSFVSPLSSPQSPFLTRQLAFHCPIYFACFIRIVSRSMGDGLFTRNMRIFQRLHHRKKKKVLLSLINH